MSECEKMKKRKRLSGPADSLKAHQGWEYFFILGYQELKVA